MKRKPSYEPDGDEVVLLIARGRKNGPGTVTMDRAVLAKASSVLQDALELTEQQSPGIMELKVDGDLDAWAAISNYLNATSRPAMSLDQAYTMLPIAHKYNIKGIIDDCIQFLMAQLPSQLRTDASSPAYIMRWIGLADDLQLDDLRHICMQKFQELVHAGRMDEALFVSGNVSISGASLASSVKAICRGTLEDMLAIFAASLNSQHRHSPFRRRDSYSYDSR